MEKAQTKKRGLLVSLIATCALVACLALAGCGAPSPASSGTVSSGTDSTGTTAQEQNENSVVSIESCKASKDYNGHKAAIVTIKWTNDTGKKTSFLMTYTVTAYVDGEEAERTFATSGNWYDDQKKIADGKTQTFKAMYEWDGKSDIEVEVTDWMNSDHVVAHKTFGTK